MPRKKLEYTSYKFICSWDELHFRLNEWGQEGWEAYTHITLKKERSTIVFFKRQIITHEQDNQPPDGSNSDRGLP